MIKLYKYLMLKIEIFIIKNMDAINFVNNIIHINEININIDT